MTTRTPQKDRTRLSLSDLRPGTRAVVAGLHVNGLLYRRLLDLGVVEGAAIEARMASPSGDPLVYRIRGADIALRKHDARLVEVTTGEASPRAESCKSASPASPRCRTCPSRSGSAPPERGTADFLVALAGNPNTGKSTLFNALTGLRQHVGNWPGKTVMRAEGRWSYGDRQFRLVDLPGTYSLLSTSVEEEIARDFILFGNPDCTVAVADATCLERNLNLVTQILQLTGKVVVCVNLLDEARRKGIAVDTDKLSDRLGVPVVGTTARNGQGLKELQKAILGVAADEIDTRPYQMRFDPRLEEAIDALVPEVEEALPGLPNPRWVALRLIDGGDVRLLEEIRSGLLSSGNGRMGAASLPSGISATGTEPRR